MLTNPQNKSNQTKTAQKKQVEHNRNGTSNQY